MNSTLRFIFNENFVKKQIYESRKQYTGFTKKPLILSKPAFYKKKTKNIDADVQENQPNPNSHYI